jgi:ubiquinone/menaquinone biosynthesis C-methylase UbiE
MGGPASCQCVPRHTANSKGITNINDALFKAASARRNSPMQSKYAWKETMEESESAQRVVANPPAGDTSNAVALHWSKVTATTDRAGRLLKTRWWQHPLIIRHINRNVCGKPVDGFSMGLTTRVRSLLKSRLPLPKGISVGCGNGLKEMNLLKQGIVETFDLYELAESRIAAGREMAQKQHLAGNARFIQGDAFELATKPGQYDLVHWNNSLHHMLNVEAAIDWSWKVLKPGGLFYMDDFVGPDRFQWSNQMLLVATAVRQALPDRLLVNQREPGSMFPRVIKKPDAEKLRQSDPSEAADSSRILDCVRRRFPGADILLTGGVIYHLALSDILANFINSKDQQLLERLLALDDFCTEMGETHYATALAFKD